MSWGAEEFASLSRRPDFRRVLGGYGPLVVAAIIFVLMVVLLPSIASERIVEVEETTPATAPAVP